jgi:hypothetical protein
MPRYRFLTDHYFNDRTISANEIAEMPDNWVPSAQVEPLDQSAVAAFHEAGPRPLGLVRSSWGHIPFPTTFWKRQKGGDFVLVGLGEGLPAKAGSIEYG